MLLSQVILKDFSVKALVSGDKGLKLVFYCNLPESDDLDINGLKNLCHKPLILKIDIDKERPNI